MSQKIEHGFAVNTETGEVSDIYIQKDVSSQNFWKIWLSDILTVLGIISNSKQLDVVLYVMGNIKQSDNTFVGSYDKIAREVGVSKRTVTAPISPPSQYPTPLQLLTNLHSTTAAVSPQSPSPTQSQ